MPEDDAFECLQCGDCCHTYAIFASVDDAEREPRIKEECIRLKRWLETPEFAYRLYPLPFHNACCFLGENNLCTIYATRPQVCRDFKPGCGDCVRSREIAARERAGERRGGEALFGPEPVAR